MHRFRPAGLAALLLCSTATFVPASAQTTKADLAAQNSLIATTGSAAQTNSPRIRPIQGLNFSLATTAQHSSETGWSTVITPDVSYRFNPHLSVDTSVPWYPSDKAFVATTAKGVTTYPLVSGHNLIGDASTAVHLSATHAALAYLGSAALGFPTGDARFGLSANTTTYNITNHLDYTIGPFDFDVEAGEGTSSSLVSRTVRKSYTASGPLANFQAGTSIDLPWNLNLDLEAYENLPIGNQKVYGTVTRQNKKGKTVTRQVLQGTGVAEDNGLTAELDLPVGTHLSLAGSYTRSIIQSYDNASIGLTWILRSPKLSTLQ